MTGAWFPAGTGIFFSPCHRVQTGSEAHPAPYPWVSGVHFPQEKWSESEADHSPRSSAEVKNAWSYTSTSPWRGASKHRYNFSFTFIVQQVSEIEIKQINGWALFITTWVQYQIALCGICGELNCTGQFCPHSAASVTERPLHCELGHYIHCTNNVTKHSIRDTFT
jgi:hypothetical protein